MLTRAKKAASKAVDSLTQNKDAKPAPDAPAPGEEKHTSAPDAPAPDGQRGTISHSLSVSTAPESARSGRSSSTLKAQILAAKAEHARRLAEKENERDRAVAELQLQAQLAALEAASSRQSRSGSRRSQSFVRDWIDESNNINKPRTSLSDSRELDRNCFDNVSHSVPDFREAAARAFFREGAVSPSFPNTSAPIEAPPPVTHTTQHPGVGTRNKNHCHCTINKNNNDLGTPLLGLAKAIENMGKNHSKKVCEISKFSGRAADWLFFKKSYEQSKARFSACDNVARLSAALHGPAREAVAIRLAAADDPDQIVQALETRFAQPEVIVLHQLSLVRALPKLADISRELNIFACRIRNCVEVIRLLQQPEYLASPELVNSIIGKLTPLLRSRWADFASTKVGSGKFKIEILADFLENESLLQTKFGVIMSEPTAVKSQSTSVNRQSHSVIHTKDKVFPYAVSTTVSDSTNSSDKQISKVLCLYCGMYTHEIGDCEKFQLLSVNDRWQWTFDNKVCRKCLKKGMHEYKTCKSRCKVKGCRMSRGHNTLLHHKPADTTGRVDVQTITEYAGDANSVSHAAGPNNCPTETVAHNVPTNARKPLLKVIPVTLTGKKGSVNVYALLDDGSSATLVDKSIADVIADEVVKVPLQLNCIGGLTKVTDVGYIDIEVKGRYCPNTYKIRARSIPDLGLKVQSAYSDDIKRFDHLSDLADVLAYDVGKPTCLIGTDNWHLMLPQSIRRNKKSDPAAVLTPLGWALFGYLNTGVNSIAFINHTEIDDCEQNLDSLIKSYYRLDSIGIQKIPHQNSSDKRALEILEKTTRRLPSGRFETGLLWRDGIQKVPESYNLALSRFQSLEKKFKKDHCYAEAYRQYIEAMIQKGYAELCTEPPNSSGITWYLPHFGVVHPQKKKLRVVHDAAAKCQGVSLNSLLLSGPDLLQPLLAIVMRFREGAVALTADIREMFPQVKIRAQDRDALRFLWRTSAEKPLLEYRMSSMIFGATSSPCTALYLKNKNASDFERLYPEAARSIIEDHYMDDFLGSVGDANTAANLASDIVTIHEKGGFEMRSWVSNDPDSLSLIPSNLCATDAAEVGLGPSSPTKTQVLGLTWLVTQDCLSLLNSIPNLPVNFTKRSVLSLLMSIYDPLGVMTPLVIKGRILFQKTWKLGLDWDDNLPDNLIDNWKSWFQDLQNISGSSIPRCYSGGETIKEAQVHIFADASEKAYACVAYWRFSFTDGSIKLALIGGKARLARLKPTTVPRLELQAALIAAHFADYVAKAHKLKCSKMFLWSDSITVLKWLRSDACSFKPFVSFRIAEITDLTDIQAWKYVPTMFNVADDATRDTGGVFSIQSRWFTGPSFLLLPETSWPCEPTSDVPVIAAENKIVTELINLLVERKTSTFSPIVADYRRFSNWLRLHRATARTHQAAAVFRSLLPQNSKAIRASLRCQRNYPLLSLDELNSAELHLFLDIQIDSFSEELGCVSAGRPVSSHSRLKNVAILLGEDGLLRLSGRTAASTAVESRPIIIDGKHQITRLLIHFYHTRFAHANNELVINEIHQRFFVIGLRPAVKQVASRCQACRIRKAKPVSPPIGDLPSARMAHHKRPFTYVGLDYFGPVNVTIGRRTAKRWIALFTCLTIRAVHLEIVENLTSDSAIMALRRFIARRGYPSIIYSDNGTAFVGAAKLLPYLYEFATSKEMQWKFIPPSAPFMGGCWERLVKNVKSALNVTLLEKSPREEVLATLLAEAEAIVNSRPLTYVAVDEHADAALTPFSFLIGTSSNDLQTQQFQNRDLISKAQWRRAQSLAQHFWQRFVREYLPTLVPRRRSPLEEVRTLKVGDVVCIADGTLPRRVWPRGRIVATYPGKDGIVRVVDVATKGGVLRRPVKKVALLVATP